MSYESIAKFAQNWGLVYFGVLFVGVLIYAFLPRNKKKFDEASRLPLASDDE